MSVKSSLFQNRYPGMGSRFTPDERKSKKEREAEKRARSPYLGHTMPTPYELREMSRQESLRDTHPQAHLSGAHSGHDRMFDGPPPDADQRAAALVNAQQIAAADLTARRASIAQGAAPVPPPPPVTSAAARASAHQRAATPPPLTPHTIELETGATVALKEEDLKALSALGDDSRGLIWEMQEAKRDLTEYREAISKEVQELEHLRAEILRFHGAIRHDLDTWILGNGNKSDIARRIAQLDPATPFSVDSHKKDELREELERLLNLPVEVDG